MQTSSQTPLANKLLARLPSSDFKLVAPLLEYVDLPRGIILGKRHEEIDYIYFLTSGVGSIVATSPAGHKAEAGLFGCEGYIPAPAARGSPWHIHDMNMQIEGAAYRLGFGQFQTLTKENDNFALLVARLTEAFSAQVTYTALSNAVHDVNERLARWLLMCHDRVEGDEIALTHEFMSLMIATRRSSVTSALHVLEGSGFIRSTRGLVTVRNREALEEFAHDAYGRPEEEYERLMVGLFECNTAEPVATEFSFD